MLKHRAKRCKARSGAPGCSTPAAHYWLLVQQWVQPVEQQFQDNPGPAAFPPVTAAVPLFPPRELPASVSPRAPRSRFLCQRMKGGRGDSAACRNAESHFASPSVRQNREKKPLFLLWKKDFHPGGCAHRQHGHWRKTQPTWLNKDCILSAMLRQGFAALMSPFYQAKLDLVFQNSICGIRLELDTFGVWDVGSEQHRSPVVQQRELLPPQA